MSKFVELKNRLDVITFIYAADTLPTAVVGFGLHDPSTVHALREGSEAILDTLLQYVEPDEKTGEFATPAFGYPNFLNYPEQGHYDIGMAALAKEGKCSNDDYYIYDAASYATKTIDDCA